MPNFTYGYNIPLILPYFHYCQRTFFSPLPYGTKLQLFFTIFQNFQSILSKFEVNRLYKYFYGIINFVQLSNLIYKSLYLYIYINNF
nr:MAG TPA: hypothetical protein [Caudoviricetes sp.]